MPVLQLPTPHLGSEWLVITLVFHTYLSTACMEPKARGLNGEPEEQVKDVRDVEKEGEAMKPVYKGLRDVENCQKLVKTGPAPKGIETCNVSAHSLLSYSTLFSSFVHP